MIMRKCRQSIELFGPLALRFYYVGQPRFSSASFDCRKVGLEQKNIFFSSMPPSPAI